jgi:transcriptional regulator with PAS, ATPase and Fis domain
VSPDALAILRRYAWPGNVRELEHEIHRLVLTNASETRIDPARLSASIRAGVIPADDTPLADLLACVELALIRQRLERFPCKTDAARSLGISREALYLKLRRLGSLGEPVVPREAAAEQAS